MSNDKGYSRGLEHIHPAQRVASLSMPDQTLADGIIETARRWVTKYNSDDSMAEHARKTLEYWGQRP